jgi:hypothetical protein
MTSALGIDTKITLLAAGLIFLLALTVNQFENPARGTDVGWRC